MIQTSIAPDGLAGVEPLCVELFELLSPPPQAATIRLATQSAASNHFDVFTIPPRSSPVRARTRTAAAPDRATPLPLNRRRAALCGRPRRMALTSTVPQRGPKLRHEPVSVSSIDR